MGKKTVSAPNINKFIFALSLAFFLGNEVLNGLGCYIFIWKGTLGAKVFMSKHTTHCLTQLSSMLMTHLTVRLARNDHIQLYLCCKWAKHCCELCQCDRSDSFVLNQMSDRPFISVQLINHIPSMIFIKFHSIINKSTENKSMYDNWEYTTLFKLHS